MTKISLRLESLASFVTSKDNIVDVGCDHGLLSIYLVENNLCQKVIASDINPNALNYAIKNINRKKLDIPTVLSDGIKNIDLKDINTLIISGMGTKTILHILEDDKKIKKINKLIIQSNNDHEILRKQLNEKGFYLKNEKYIYEKEKWYITMLFIKSNKKNSSNEITYGYLDNKDYIAYLIDKYKIIKNKIPIYKIKLRRIYTKKIHDLKNY